MTGGLLAIGVTGVVLWNRDSLIKRCSKSMGFSLLVSFAGCTVIILAAVLYLIGGR